MAEYATFSDLQRYAEGLNEAQMRKSVATKSSETNLFLSHSSADDKWLPGLIRLLQEHGAIVYVDREDGQLPPIPSPQTAAILRDALRSCPRFVLFVSRNTKDSTWIPWELGLSDGYCDPRMRPVSRGLWRSLRADGLSSVFDQPTRFVAPFGA